MLSPEWVVISVNAVVISIAYFFIYPRFCGANVMRIAINDLIASLIVIAISGALYFGAGHSFNGLLFSTNWFWYTLIVYFVIETPLMLWYFKKHDIWSSM